MHFSLLVISDTKPDSDDLLKMLYNDQDENDWFVIGGRWAGHFDGPDSVQVKTLTKPIKVTCCVLKDGQYHGEENLCRRMNNRSRQYDFGYEQNPDPDNKQWEADFGKLVTDLSPNTWLTIVDCHE